VKGKPPAAGLALTYSLPGQTHPPVKGGFWFLGGSNKHIVRRSWGFSKLRPDSTLPYGDDFDYEEFVSVQGTFRAALLSIAIAFAAVLLAFAPV
jgi:hypothetical protein